MLPIIVPPDKQSRTRHGATYRPDIDGIRAIAVISVVLFHAFPRLLPGGFVGVDIFFVISGYLITSIISQGLHSDNFRIRRFYSSRVKRIFPALILVLSSSLIFGALLFLATEYKALGLQVFSGSSFISNFSFLSQSGYFDADSQTKPLLHLWSLAIEEQFYLFWPILVLFSWRRGWNILLICAFVGIASFSFNLLFSLTASPLFDASADFYLPITRFWELMVGAILSARPKWASAFAERFSNPIAMAGVALFALSVASISSLHAYPGVWALLPTLSAFLLISAGPDAWVNRAILSNRLMVWVGLISYPLYLWHWPLLSFARIVDSKTPQWPIRAALVLLALGLAWVTYQLVERPIRFGGARGHDTRILAFGMACVGLAGAGVFAIGGASDRPAARLAPINAGEIGHSTFQIYLSDHFVPCGPAKLRSVSMVWEGHTRCYQSKSDRPRDIAIVGDSHGEHLFPGLSEKMNNDNIVYYNENSLPYIDNPAFRDIYNYVTHDSAIKTVILAADWGERTVDASQHARFSSELSKTVHALRDAGKKVLISDDTPNFSFDPEKCKFSRPFSTNQCSESGFISTQYNYYGPIIDKVSQGQSQIFVLHSSKYFCDRLWCSMSVKGRLLFRDRNHLNIEGSRYLAAHLVHDNSTLDSIAPTSVVQ